ncbi:hypothetical protein [Mastigocoleus sp. MO_188.B34]|uniref:hypothetical protein n=1 Tax=Mastigocoleus sp. MO_188.B34 TaxID=3036635 RepID=UPI002624F213|nr:hypothetical protein [Mastigocoleus sp. MO_188.B34]MDJ0696293.1 hypothetical protein [Mastigocoleus sp. MO_188.B34]
MNIGVYFSANDIVYDWAIAFLNSFRKFNPNLRLILIPFNEECDRILTLKEIYNFEVYIDSSFPRLEAIGRAFELGHTPTGPYWFRRYASFWGPLDLFMYLDARQLVLADLKPIILALEKYDFHLLHFDCAINQVYEPGELRRNLLRKGRTKGFNSGRWISKKGLFSLEEFENLAEDALQVREELNPRNTDQAFINYCCDMKSICYGHVAEVIGGICQNAWARQPGNIYQQDGKYYIWDYGGLDHKKQLIILHWAGFKLNPLMPHKFLFYSYLLKNKSVVKWLLISILFRVYYLLIVPFKTLRENRMLNNLYHKFKRLILKQTVENI